MPFDDMRYLELALGVEPNVLKAIQNNDQSAIEENAKRMVQKMVQVLKSKGMQAYRRGKPGGLVVPSENADQTQQALQRNFVDISGDEFASALLKASQLREVTAELVEIAKFAIKREAEKSNPGKTRVSVKMVDFLGENDLKDLVYLFEKKRNIQELGKLTSDLMNTQGNTNKKAVASLIKFKKSLEKGKSFNEDELRKISKKFSDPEKAFSMIQRYQSNFSYDWGRKLVQEKKPIKLPDLDFLRKMRISSETQKDMDLKLQKLFQAHKNSDGSNQDIAEKILMLLKENQNRHQQATLSTASSFNLKAIQNLPVGLKEIVCKKLNIPSKLLTDFSYKNRRELAEIINKYNPKTADKIVNPRNPRV